MESTVHLPNAETTPVWTEEKHVRFLNTMEASFVRTMLHRYGGGSAYHHHYLRLDRHLPDTSESTLDSKPRRASNKHAPSDSLGPRSRMDSTRRRRRSSPQVRTLIEEQIGSDEWFSRVPTQVVPQLESVGEGAAFAGDDLHKEQHICNA